MDPPGTLSDPISPKIEFPLNNTAASSDAADGKAMAQNEEVRTAAQIDDERRPRERMAVIREFVESKTRKPGKVGRN